MDWYFITYANKANKGSDSLACSRLDEIGSHVSMYCSFIHTVKQHAEVP